ncbi:HNH endonuclease [Methylomonas albis]|uniref:HNH endonuclease n=1 Tax=Methylomonas albis TaxID=1854563 RepID=A0ABR9D700_9GAMM|nr:HNH endonuclease [Methylomonas albis]MBD9358848.1 HNH endonuclease [Methylomonas albis]
MSNFKKKDLNHYLLKFKNLRRDRKNGGAPHKPILLLSIISLFESNPLQTNQIYITPELISFFKTNWATLVNSDHHMIFALPFYHLISDGFWRLVANPGCEKWVEAKSAMRSFSNLNTAVQYAELDFEITQLLKDLTNREILKKFLLEEYFPKHTYHFENNSGHTNLDDIANKIREESPTEYKQHLINLKTELDKNAYEEEIFIRGSLFKREIPKVYNNTCSVTGLRIDAVISVSMIDACHITPFSESYDDTISNGIALCPNLHRAFDRGLISIDANYRVMISSTFSELSKSTHSIRQFERQIISLPDNPLYFPSQENLASHRKKYGFL